MYSDIIEGLEEVHEASKQQQIVDYIKKQVNVDINDYRDDTTRQFDKRNLINVDWKSMSHDTKNKINQAANAYGGTLILQDSGSWMKSISLR